MTAAERRGALRSSRDISERELAIALVLLMAEFGEGYCVSLMGFYDDDADFLSELATRLVVEANRPFLAKVVRVARRLVNFGVLHSRMRGTSKEYVDEPAKTQIYWLKAGKAGLLTRGRTEFTMDPAGEAAFLLRHAYPEARHNQGL